MMLTTDELARLRAPESGDVVCFCDPCDHAFMGRTGDRICKACAALAALPELLRVYEAVLAAPEGLVGWDTCGTSVVLASGLEYGTSVKILVPLATAKGAR